MASRYTYQEMEACVALIEKMRRERGRLAFTQEHYQQDLSRGFWAMAQSRLSRAEQVEAEIAKMQGEFDAIVAKADEALEQNPADRRALLIRNYADCAMLPPKDWSAYMAGMKSLKARVQKEKDQDNMLSLW